MLWGTSQAGAAATGAEKRAGPGSQGAIGAQEGDRGCVYWASWGVGSIMGRGAGRQFQHNGWTDTEKGIDREEHGDGGGGRMAAQALIPDQIKVF